MKRLFPLLILTGFVWSDTLVVEIAGAQQRGDLYVGLYKPSNEFTSFKDSYRHKIIKSPKSKGKLELTFADIPNGEYGVALFEDENGNGKLDRNFLGIPTEGYGLSNNHTTPDFNTAKFKLKQYKKISIKVQK